MSREFKYLNESGTKVGCWYLNRLDYFEFHAFPEKWKVAAKCLLMLALCSFLLQYFPIVLIPLLIWVGYVALLTLFILFQKQCRYRGYFLFPAKIVRFFWEYRKGVDVDDFDSLATAEKAGQKKGAIKGIGPDNRYK